MKRYFITPTAKNLEMERENSDLKPIKREDGGKQEDLDKVRLEQGR